MKKKIAYTAYIVGITVFFLYALFPGESVTAYINHQVRKMYPGINLAVRELKPGFPAGMNLSAVDVSHRNNLLLGADQLAVRLALPSLFSRQKKIRVQGDLYDGSLDSTFKISDIRANPKLEIQGIFKDIQVEKIPMIRQYEDYRISGVLSGNMDFSNLELPQVKGNATLTLTESAVQFTPALFGLERLTFETISTELELINQRLMIKRLDMESRDVSGSATGSIILGNPIERSTINIRGEIKPHPSFIKQLGSVFPMEFMARNKTKTGGIPFRISGSIEHPNFSMR